MDRRSWPWKKKSSEKSDAEKAIATLDSAGGSFPSAGCQAYKDNYKRPTYVQISVESYTHLTGLENQVKTYEEQLKTYEDQVQTLEEEINELNENLSSANSEITTKEELVKQHAKVAEEAVSGWEKAEAEALALKNHLESVTLAKQTVEDKAAHLDGALKECMRQIRNLKEENEQKLKEVALTKNKQYDKMKHELETKIAYLDQDLMSAEAEKVAISRSLQERSNILIKVNEEKSRAEAEIELLRSNVDSCEREINSLKYELHIVSKEMEIRNEEKNMSVKIAEVANKQNLESVKKIAKLEGECQRLRGLVRKKLPGPAALAQMRLEVESLSRSPMRPELSLDGVEKFQKENEFLTERLLAMEDETKMLKEVLTKRNNELQTCRSMCAMTTNKLQRLESQLQAFNLQKGFPLSEDGKDDTESCAESWASSLISEVSHIKEKNKDKSVKSENGSHLELMNDFEEMEKLACNGSKTMPEKGSLNGKEVKISQEIEDAISRIHSFVMTLGKEARAVHVCDDGDGMNLKVEQFSAIFKRVLCNEISVDDFVLALSDIIAKVGDLSLGFLGYKVNEAEVSSPACIDKVALPENKVPQGESYSIGCGHISDSSSNPEVPQEANILSSKCSVEEFEQLKAEKDGMERVIFRCSADLDIAKSELKEVEQQLSEVKTELESSQKMNSLAETQLKCMAESYKTLERRAEELEGQVSVLLEKMKSLNDELETERRSHQDALDRCRDLKEQLQRNEECSVCSSLAAEVDNKAKQEKELEAAAEKLVACQETIFLLGKQLKSMRPKTQALNEDEPITNGMNPQDMSRVEMDTPTSPLDLYNTPFSPSDTERNITRSPISSKTPTHRPTMSGSSTASSTPTPEKHPRGFTRFFSSKGT